MNIKHMEYFITLSEEKSFSKASEKLGISQPTLSQSIQKLESTLGAPLFDRSLQKLELTSIGTIFLESCLKISDIYSQTTNRINEINNGINGTVKIGLGPSRAPYIIPMIAEKMRNEFPDVKLQIDELISVDILEKLSNGEIDIAITTKNGKGNSDLNAVPITKEYLMIALTRENAEKNGKLPIPESPDDTPEADISAFADENFILLGEEQTYTKQLKTFAKEKNITLHSSVSCKNFETSMSLANAGIGTAVLLSTSYMHYREKYKNLCFYKLALSSAQKKVYVVYRNNSYLTAPAKAIIKILSKGETKK